MHKSLTGSRFIVASKEGRTKFLIKTIPKIFKMIYPRVENFRNKSQFHLNFKQSWVLQNYFPIAEKVTKINSMKDAKKTSTFDFSALCTTIPHNLLFKVFNKIISLDFNCKKKIRVRFSESSVHWTLYAEACNFNKRLLHGLFLTFFKLCKWYQIAQSDPVNSLWKNKVISYSHFSTFFIPFGLRR